MARTRKAEDDTALVLCPLCYINIAQAEPASIIFLADRLPVLTTGYLAAEYRRLPFCSWECVAGYAGRVEQPHIAAGLVQMMQQAAGREITPARGCATNAGQVKEAEAAGDVRRKRRDPSGNGT